MSLAALVETCTVVTATRSRTAKVAALAGLLALTSPDDIPVVVGLLLGKPRQGRIGVGWRSLADLDAEPADAPSLTVGDVDAVFTELAESRGAGSQNERRALLTGLFLRATPPERDHLHAVLTGQVRTGALEGVLTDAVAVASGLPVARVRRAAMLTGDLAVAAQAAA
ncbi:MAG: ATP-dependent DNA ligase, partial [Gordonia sp. (in: high G+C Gram-positive bacteria)]